MHEVVERRQRTGRNRHRVCFGPAVDDPYELEPIGAFGPYAFVADDEQVALEERHDSKAVIGRVIVLARHHLGMRLV